MWLRRRANYFWLFFFFGTSRGRASARRLEDAFRILAPWIGSHVVCDCFDKPIAVSTTSREPVRESGLAIGLSLQLIMFSPALFR